MRKDELLKKTWEVVDAHADELTHQQYFEFLLELIDSAKTRMEMEEDDDEAETPQQSLVKMVEKSLEADEDSQ